MKIAVLLLSLAVLAMTASAAPSADAWLPTSGLGGGDEQGATIDMASALDALAATVDEGAVVEAALSGKSGRFTGELLMQPMEDACQECAVDVAHKIMGMVLEHIKEQCEHTKCPFIKRACEHMREHPEVTLGILLAKINPLTKGFFFCAGKGVCGHHQSVDDIKLADTVDPIFGQFVVAQDFVSVEALRDIVSLNQTFELDQADLPSMMDDNDDESESDSVEALELSDSNDNSNEDHHHGHHPEPHHHGHHPHHHPDHHHGHHGDHERFRRCVHFGAHHIIHHIVGHIIEFCHKHKDDPKIHERCEWMRHHPGIVIGHLIVHVRPAEFASGFCTGLVAAHHHHERHHGHDHHHPHHPPHHHGQQ
eukprot:TRINITY_DN65626_c14_g1_i1.p1 TRINITY_DN65626_c14_g1~~TRINITY_DN65626_c14_g1_i1.p1  ORF type:complete len:398 (+),score=216.79 TRINITY_DN65626_c14_g1_i1:101-1195(+)